jgi:diaminopimelate epimerase
MQLAYLKMHGAGNRIVVIDERETRREPPDAAVLRRLGSEATGPGFDQLLWVGPASNPAMDASYRVFNADGSEVEQCGNGVRCVVRMLGQGGGGQRWYLLESPAGPVEAELHEDGQVTVNMGPPEFEPGRIPFEADAMADQYTLEAGGDLYTVSCLSMGNPHCVIEVDDVDSADVARIGSLVESHPRFPTRTNVGFMAIRDRSTVDLRVFERGVGETLACGTGACAAVVSGRRLGKLDEDVTVRLPGGQLVVSWRAMSEPVWLTGNAELISEGTIHL